MRKQLQSSNNPIKPTTNQYKKLNISDYINQQEILNKKIINIPLEFQYIPVQILSKQFTKLNNNHNFRIHYLGPRYKNTIELHKKNAYSESKPYVYNSNLMKNLFNNYEKQNHHQQQKPQIQARGQIQKYKINHLKIYNSYVLEEKFKKTQYFKSTIYYRAFEGMNPTLNLDNQFVFNSCFQAGNLDCVIKIESRQFDLFLRIDSNTRGHLLWFFFSVKNGKQTGNIKMNICNFSKSKTLYQNGMKPYVFSSIKYKQFNKTWQQDGLNLGFDKKQFRYQILGNNKNISNNHCLTIGYDFQYQNDQVFFAYCIPYTFSQLSAQIETLPNKFVKKTFLGKSLLGTPIPLLYINEQTIQNQNSKNYQIKNETTGTNVNTESQSKQTNQKILKQKIQFSSKQKKIIFITGRIHPSQSNSSYVLMGFIRWLCSQQKEAIELRKIASFIIIPMVNPDGVILGNSRTSAAGKDLNRQYLNSDPSLYPEVHQVKQLVTKIHQQHKIYLFFDFHGHSRKKNTFFYGPVYSISSPTYYKSRILPKIIENIYNPFRYHSCSFTILQEKKKTARAFMFQGLNVPYSYTIQSSIGYFYDSQKQKVYEFTQEQYTKTGQSIAKGTSIFFIGLIQYDQMIEEKRRIRQNSKKNSRYKIQAKIQYLQDRLYEELDKNETLKITYSQKQFKKKKKINVNVNRENDTNYFIQMLNQLYTNNQKSCKINQNQKSPQKISQKTFDVKTKDQDKDEQSDSHNEKQDMQLKILNEFKYVVNSHFKTQSSPQKNKKIQTPVKIIKNKQLTNKITDEFQLLQGFGINKQTCLQRNIKTGDGKRNTSQKLTTIKYRQKTLPEQSLQNFQSNQNLIENLIRKSPQNKIFRRSVYTSIKKDQRNQIIIPKFFGEFHLLIDQTQNQEKKNKQKADLIKKLRNRRQKQRKQRIQSKIDIKNNLSFNSSNNLKNNFFQHQQKQHNQQFIQPFSLSIPFERPPEYASTNYYKPKLKLNLRANRSNSISIKHFYQYSPQKKTQQQMTLSQKCKNTKSFVNKIQDKIQIKFENVFGKKRIFRSEKNTGRDIGKQKRLCTTINLNQLGNTRLIDSSHRRIFQF